MSLQQKIAWFNLSVTLLTVVAYFALWPMIGPWRAMGAFGLLGFTGLSALYVQIRGSRKQVVSDDERDQAIGLRAFAIAKGIIWVALIMAFLVALEYFGGQGAVPMQLLALAVWFAICAFMMAQAVATLILYSRQ